MTYRIRTVSEITGIPRNTLIAWERRYGFVKPDRHENSYRSYSDEDIAKLKRVKAAVDSGLTISESIALVETQANDVAPSATEHGGSSLYLDRAHITKPVEANQGHSGAPPAKVRGRAEQTKPEDSQGITQGDRSASLVGLRGRAEQTNQENAQAAATVEHPAEHASEPLPREPFIAFEPFAALRERLLLALLDYRASDVERALGELLGVSYDVRIHQVFFPILREIGRRWQAGEASVAQEHYAAALLREQMTTMLASLGQNHAASRHAATTTFPGDLHELAALAMAIRLSQAGWRVSYLGANLPVEELAGFCRAKGLDLVSVSTIVSHKRAAILEYVRQLRELVPERVRIVVGGTGVDLTPSLVYPGVEIAPRWSDFAIDQRNDANQ